jgi:hypothetical protein
MIITTRMIAECLGLAIRSVNQRSEARSVPIGIMIGHSKVYDYGEAIALCKSDAEKAKVQQKWGRHK